MTDLPRNTSALGSTVENKPAINNLNGVDWVVAINPPRTTEKVMGISQLIAAPLTNVGTEIRAPTSCCAVIKSSKLSAFAVDLTAPLRVAVTEPHLVMKVPVYPAILSRGGAIVCLERMGENEALQLRVLEPLHDFHEHILRGYGEPRRLPDLVLEDYLPKFRHLPLRARDLLPDPASKRAEPFVWRYSVHVLLSTRELTCHPQNDAVPNRDAALHCLPHPYEHFPVPTGTPDPAAYPRTPADALASASLTASSSARAASTTSESTSSPANPTSTSRKPPARESPTTDAEAHAKRVRGLREAAAAATARDESGWGFRAEPVPERAPPEPEALPAPEPALGPSEPDTPASSSPPCPPAPTPAASGWGSFLEGVVGAQDDQRGEMRADEEGGGVDVDSEGEGALARGGLHDVVQEELGRSRPYVVRKAWRRDGDVEGDQNENERNGAIGIGTRTRGGRRRLDAQYTRTRALDFDLDTVPSGPRISASTTIDERLGTDGVPGREARSAEKFRF
ncbi:hypothetical protein B0H14DRAFT_2565884 [Mycena olivaceomarginata]|nr:hypothetical protein B0H14DRAFT_2565884 [Mycena olivaceomarginata]